MGEARREARGEARGEGEGGVPPLLEGKGGARVREG